MPDARVGDAPLYPPTMLCNSEPYTTLLESVCRSSCRKLVYTRMVDASPQLFFCVQAEHSPSCEPELWDMQSLLPLCGVEPLRGLALTTALIANRTMVALTLALMANMTMVVMASVPLTLMRCLIARHSAGSTCLRNSEAHQPPRRPLLP